MTGKQFKAAREAMGLSVSQLADKLDVNRSTIFRIEQTGCTRVMQLAMERLADRWQGEQLMRDLANGMSVTQNGKRIDPSNFYLSPPTVFPKWEQGS
jgi:DNA-binding XRE family transcriptional regulator